MSCSHGNHPDACDICDEVERAYERGYSQASQGEQAKPLTDEQIERLREKTFSTNNPYCPVDSKSMRKAVRAAEAAHGIAAAEAHTGEKTCQQAGTMGYAKTTAESLAAGLQTGLAQGKNSGEQT